MSLLYTGLLPASRGAPGLGTSGDRHTLGRHCVEPLRRSTSSVAYRPLMAASIGTYSQAGAQFGFNLLWVVLLTYPLMTAIQLVSAQIGRVTGKGLASNVRAHYPASLLYCAVGLLIVANVINIAADLSAMGAAVGLLLPGPQHLYVVVLGAFSVVLQIFVPYDRYASILKWTALSLLAYVAVAFIVPIHWGDVAHAIVLPKMSLKPDYLTTVVAVLGTTISPYLFFWQASKEVEEMRSAPGQAPLLRVPQQAPAQLRRIRFDTWVGMGVSNFVAFFIMLTAAATLHLHHIEVQTSSDAARALEPIAGRFAYDLRRASVRRPMSAAGTVRPDLLTTNYVIESAAYEEKSMPKTRIDKLNADLCKLTTLFRSERKEVVNSHPSIPPAPRFWIDSFYCVLRLVALGAAHRRVACAGDRRVAAAA